MDISNSKFSSLFFTRNSDSVFHAGLLFRKYGNVPTSVLEFLFFAQTPKSGAVFWLTFLENYNQQFEFVEKWFSELKDIKDEFDWNFKRAQLRSKFILYTPVNTEKALMAFKDEPQVYQTIRNTGIIWNNCISTLTGATYFPEKTTLKYELWDILLSLKNGEEPLIQVTEKHIEAFEQLIFHRSNNTFLKTHHLELSKNSEEKEYIEYLEKSLESWMRKNKLAQSLIKKPIGEKIKSIFKI